MFYDLQDISIPFPEYQISEEEKTDIENRVKNLADKNKFENLPYEEEFKEELYSLYVIDKKDKEYIIVYFGLTTDPSLVYLTPEKDWIDENILAFLLKRAKGSENTIRFHQSVYEDELYYMAEIREKLHKYALLPEDKYSDEYKAAYLEDMQLLMMMLYDLDYKKIKIDNPKIEEQLEDIIPIEDIDPKEYWKKKIEEQYYQEYDHAQFY